MFKLQRLTSEQTPNFAMDTSDIDANADGGEKRYTTQFFDPDNSDIPLLNAKIQVPADTSSWPPASLFEAAFANAVVRHFHVENDYQPFLKVLKKWDGMFYPGGSMTTKRAEKRRHDHDADIAEESPEHKSRKKTETDVLRSVPGTGGIPDDWCGAIDPFDYLRILPYIAMGAEKTKKYLEECEEIAAAAKCKANEDKINAWREGLTGNSSVI